MLKLKDLLLEKDTLWSGTSWNRYEQRNGTRPKDNVAKYVFKLSTDEIRVDYHHMERHITHNSRMYKKDGSLTLMQVE